MDDFKAVIFTILALLVIGVPIGFKLRPFTCFKKVSEKVVGISVYLILLLLGAGLGANQNLMSQLAEMSYAAVVITLGAVVGSALVSWLVYRLFFIRKAGKLSRGEE
ncbi:MAG: LysO family transporter [Desulfovibrionaceae bacterium]|nr:LysO family transporter [Desulfovibrionaceae bacterium]